MLERGEGCSGSGLAMEGLVAARTWGDREGPCGYLETDPRRRPAGVKCSWRKAGGMRMMERVWGTVCRRPPTST